MRRLLIANRGEIARRIIRTAHRMGIETVAVHSEADARAPFVREATRAVAIGPAAPAESYLVIENVIEAARKAGADAIHPGYGFLSENVEFARACVEAGIVFVGPPPAAISAMGLKDEAKAIMAEAGVPVVPGYFGEDQSPDRLMAEAERIGYPILIKAVAGGGGKGMRRVDAPEDFEENLLSCRREAARAFGNDRVLLERYILGPRHVEVQVFADGHGHVVHLFERDCSVQRRHQKVLEEAPAPNLPEALRAAMREAAVKAAAAIGYVGAGTVEFIVETEAAEMSFFFMEMNTRLQVEHPVTECITGFDLVEWQLRVARGETLPVTQHDICVSGHAVEARLYAEDPQTGFLPSIGRLSRLEFGSGPGIRIDSGVEEGGTITPHYDPMIAKLIAYGPDRAEVIDRLIAALDATVVDGVRTNRAYLAQLLDHPVFRSGTMTTGFIAERGEELAAAPQVPEELYAVAAAALALPNPPPPGDASPWTAFGAFRLNGPLVRQIDFGADPGSRRHLRVTCEGDQVTVEGLEQDYAGQARWLDGKTFEEDFFGTIARNVVIARPEAVELRREGQTFVLVRGRAGEETGGGAGSGRILTPMPGKVVSVHVEAGTRVEAGARLVVVEAMKMEHRIVAPVAANVLAVKVAAGDQVGEGAVLIELEPEP
ncbi:MAG: ATP-grasp domain-containing protein [Pseudomonadota bacterium]|nr:ATP-grasp domain-containing protein [Pseudomonadota bacterium]